MTTMAPTRLTPEQRAAVVLVSLGQEQAKMMAEQLGVDMMRRIRDALTDMPFVSQEDMLAALAEFITQLNVWSTGIRGGESEALNLLRQALGEKLVEQIRGPIEVVEQPSDVWEEFGALESDVIADFASQQHGAVSSLMLYKLSGDRIPEVLGLMDPDAAVDAIGHMSRPNDPSPAALAVAEAMINDRLLKADTDPGKDPKVIMIGETLGTLPRALREAALTRLEGEDAVRAQAIRAALLQIDDIPKRLPTKSVQVLFKDIDRKIMVEGLAAVKVDTPDVSEFLLANIAQRMADQFRDDMAALPDMEGPRKDKAIGALVREILSLSRRGDITLVSIADETED